MSRQPSRPVRTLLVRAAGASVLALLPVVALATPAAAAPVVLEPAGKSVQEHHSGKSERPRKTEHHPGKSDHHRPGGDHRGPHSAHPRPHDRNQYNQFNQYNQYNEHNDYDDDDYDAPGVRPGIPLLPPSGSSLP